MKRSGDWAKYILDLPMAVAPGEKFEYSNGVSYLLTVLIQKATKMTAMDFARQYLFGPLGIEDVKWRVSPQGINTGWGGMCLKPHDMAKIGWLYLNKGQWEGKQIVSEEWVEASTRGHIRATLFDHYGYQWWIDSAGYYMAVGLEGQYIFVVPQKDMVAVFTSNLPPNRFYVPKKLLDTYIIPAATSSEPLPNNTSEKVRLDSLLDRYAEGPTQGVVWRSERDGVAKDGVFERTAPPTVKFEYPRGSRKEDIKYPNQIMGIKTPEGDIISVFVDDIPQGMKLVDIGPKGYVPLLQNVGTDIQVTSNKEITLKDGNNAYRTDIEWMFQGSYLLNTIVVSAFKDGKWVFLTAQPIFDPAQVAPIVESLVFD